MPNEKPKTPNPARRVRLIRIGRDQAVRIPREFEMNADEVLISREGDRLVVVAVQKPLSLAEVLSRLKPIDEDLPNCADPATKPQDFL
ncbi:MAG: AbrB/MazE/SpoVT family DNA-binding domain-containing protein [Acidobacteria bacterium]|nr:AbrB/MazE/SpoVT family DNA-binding domain-containing protein [Acidobacteriota bacterium]